MTITHKIVCDGPHCGAWQDLNPGDTIPDDWFKLSGSHYCPATITLALKAWLAANKETP